MDGTWSVIVPIIGAVLTTLLGVLVGGAVSNRSQRQQWSHDRQVEACTMILRESSNMLIELAALSATHIDPAPEGVRVPTTLDWKPWNEALAMVNLVADHAIAEAAHAIDEKMWKAHIPIKRGWASDQDWFRLRDDVEEQRRAFVNVARRQLTSQGPPLRRLTGRPDPDDPAWDRRQTSTAEK